MAYRKGEYQQPNEKFAEFLTSPEDIDMKSRIPSMETFRAQTYWAFLDVPSSKKLLDIVDRRTLSLGGASRKEIVEAIQRVPRVKTQYQLPRGSEKNIG